MIKGYTEHCSICSIGWGIEMIMIDNGNAFSDDSIVVIQKKLSPTMAIFLRKNGWNAPHQVLVAPCGTLCSGKDIFEENNTYSRYMSDIRISELAVKDVRTCFFWIELYVTMSYHVCLSALDTWPWPLNHNLYGHGRPRVMAYWSMIGWPMVFMWYPLVNVYTTNWKITIFNG